MAEATVPTTTDETERTTATRDEERYLTPAVDIYETESELVVVADFPGVSKERVDVRVADGVLTIQGRAEYRPSTSPIVEEFALGTFYRQFRLSEEIDQDAIKAELKHGVLNVRLPKIQRKPRQIKVTVG